MSAIPASLQAQFDSTVAPWFFGILASTFLFGIVIAQTYEFYDVYRDERVGMKVYVGLLILVTAIGCACDLVTLHFRLIQNFGHYPAAMYGNPGSNSVVLFLSPITSAACQGFFAHRTYKSNRNVWVAAVLGVAIVGTLASGITVAAIAMVFYKTLSASSLDFLLSFIQAFTWMSAGVDVMISATFLYTMFALGKAEYASTDSVLRKLMVMSFQTALLTSTFAVCNSVFSKAQGTHGNWALMFNLFLPRIFVITVLFVLNSRQVLRSQMDPINLTQSRFGRKSQAPGQIEVTLQTFTRTDAAALDEGKWMPATGHSSKGGVKFANE